ncbi:hypothetical protein SAMN05661080_04176 [Modestobacter sp. DSM 44400]|uniref:hypothetical protein n=1 Tax=Modestobacter sp. DSM 44400 TaxID=1550230 RepID=UPI00089621E7|nr:hypothetical protein [Modestobacter sp. DSM 44400]SDY65585.1 hypothetical protein SAMN05661080_04176 [Modestobacter sp. DSM 44400]
MVDVLAASAGLGGSGVVLVLCLVACPLIMGVMMWAMRRGADESAPASTGHGANGPNRSASGEVSGKQRELVRLRAEIDQLRAGEADARRGRTRPR